MRTSRDLATIDRPSLDTIDDRRPCKVPSAYPVGILCVPCLWCIQMVLCLLLTCYSGFSQDMKLARVLGISKKLKKAYARAGV